MALVVPAHFVFAGILIYTAIVAAVVGIYRQRVGLYLAFAATCLFSAGITAALASYYLTDSVGGAVESFRLGYDAAIFFLASMFVFIARYTEAPRMTPWYWVAAGLAAIFLALNHLLPNSLRFSEIRDFGWTHYSWGESTFRLHGSPGFGNIGFRLTSFAVVWWGIWRLAGQYRRGRRREAVVLAVYLLVLVAASEQGALIDLGVLDGFHTVGLALVGLALLMGINLVMGLAEQTRALQETAAQLRAENERRRAAEAQIRERAYRDPLTGLPNRLALQEHLALTVAVADAPARGAVLQVNLDHFKVVNDALSHGVGDELLREVAARVRETVAGRGFVSRLGGDEFVVVLEGPIALEEEAAQRVRVLAEDLSEAFTRPFTLGEQSLNVPASIGTAIFSGEDAADEILRRVDMALHQAKRRGRNTITVFSPDLQRRAEEKYRVVDGLRRAIRSGELSLHYQPQLDAEGRVFGAEALLRWRSAAMGPVLPSSFIPIAEETGLIHSLGEWVLQRGCESLAAWRRDAAGFDGHLAINVSPWQLARPDFIPRLRDVLQRTRADPGQVTLEITESALLYDVGEAVAKLRDLRPLGVRVSLDDFGTGYSSLALLKDLPLDAIKIDQSFVRRLEESANQHLVRIVVALGAELGLDVIAEGVETAAQRDRLLELGCRLMQGFLWCRPVPDSEFLAWVRARHAGSAPAADKRLTA
jgi:diguanylate cyclase (GGDEF)-like protein